MKESWQSLGEEQISQKTYNFNELVFGALIEQVSEVRLPFDNILKVEAFNQNSNFIFIQTQQKALIALNK
jgi:hypothetical protein